MSEQLTRYFSLLKGFFTDRRSKMGSFLFGGITVLGLFVGIVIGGALAFVYLSITGKLKQ